MKIRIINIQKQCQLILDAMNTGTITADELSFIKTVFEKLAQAADNMIDMSRAIEPRKGEKILEATWFSPLGSAGNIGIVATSSGDNGEWKTYIGEASGQDENRDKERIRKLGSKFFWGPAVFEHLDKNKFIT